MVNKLLLGSSRSTGRCIKVKIVIGADQSGNIAGALIGQNLFNLQTYTEVRRASGATMQVFRDRFTVHLYISITGPSKVCVPQVMMKMQYRCTKN